MGHGHGNQLKLLQEIRFPHSLGLLYSAFTYYTGFRVNSGEYKLMGLAPYGEPKYKDLILSHLIDLKPDGSMRMDMSYFNYCQGLTMTGPKFHRLFGGPPRQPESLVTHREMDLAASIQAVTEEVMLRMARHAHRLTGSKNLVLAGGVALNCVGNGRILREGPFENFGFNLPQEMPAAHWAQLYSFGTNCSTALDVQARSTANAVRSSVRSFPMQDICSVLEQHQAVFQSFPATICYAMRSPS